MGLSAGPARSGNGSVLPQILSARRSRSSATNGVKLGEQVQRPTPLVAGRWDDPRSYDRRRGGCYGDAPVPGLARSDRGNSGSGLARGLVATATTGIVAAPDAPNVAIPASVANAATGHDSGRRGGGRCCCRNRCEQPHHRCRPTDDDRSASTTATATAAAAAIGTPAQPGPLESHGGHDDDATAAATTTTTTTTAATTTTTTTAATTTTTTTTTILSSSAATTPHGPLWRSAPSAVIVWRGSDARPADSGGRTTGAGGGNRDGQRGPRPSFVTRCLVQSYRRSSSAPGRRSLMGF